MPIFNKDLPAFDKPLEGFPQEGEVYKGKALPDTLHPSVPSLGTEFSENDTTDVEDVFRMNSFKSGPVFGSTVSELSKNKRYDYYKPGVNYEDIYARTQPWYKQIGNGFVKMGAFALGTFAQGFNSIPQTVNAVAKGDLKELSGNDTYVAPVDDWIKNFEDTFPNYYSDYEKAHPFKSILGSGFANTFGDKFVKNLGFMGGAIASAVVQDAIVGAVTQGLGEIPLLANQIGKAALALNKLFSSETAAGRVLGATEKSIITSFLESGAQAGRTAKQLEKMESLAQLAASRKINNQFRYGLNLWTSALTEGAIESRDGYRTLKNDLIEQYKLDNFGIAPSGKDLKDIEDIATSAMNARMVGNLGILMLSNAIQFENILKPFSSARTGLNSPIFQEIAGKRVALQNGLMGGYSEVVPKSFLGKAYRSISPYIPELFTEGVFEEGGQYALERGTYDYYNKKYLDQKNNRSRNDAAEFINSLGEGLVDQFSTTAGLENMFLGALTAGLTGKAKSVYSNVKGTGAKAQVAAEINNLNSHQLTGVFEHNFENAAQQLKASKDMEAAVKNKDIFSYKNAQFKALFSWVNSRLQSGRFGLLEDEIKLAKELPDDQFKQMFGFDASSDNKNIVNEYLSLVQEEANKIKSNYDKVNEYFVNPYKYIRTPKTDEEIAESENYNKYERYKTAMTYFPSLIDHANKRGADIQAELFKINPTISVDVVKKLGSVESMLDLAKEYEKEATDSLKLITEITSSQEKKKYERKAKDLRNLAEKIYSLTNDAVAQKENVQGDYIKLFNNLLTFEVNNRDGSIKDNYLTHPLDVEKVASFAVDLNKIDEMKKEAGEAFDILSDSEKGFEEFSKVDENRLPPKHAIGSELAPGREYQAETLGKYKTKKIANNRYQVIGPDKTIISTHDTKEEAAATSKYLNANLNNLLKVKIVRDNGNGTVRITDKNGDIQDIPKEDILKYTPIESQAEKIAKQKQQILAEQNDLQGDSGSVNTGSPTEDYSKESSLVDINIMFASSSSESEKEGYYVDDNGNVKDPKTTAVHLRNAREFLNKAFTLTNRANLRAILVTPLLEKTYGLSGLTQISYGVRNEDLQTEEQKAEFLKRTTDLENGFIAQVFVEQVGSDLYFIDKNGKRLGKLGDQLDDVSLGNVIFQTMRSTSLTDSKGNSRVRSNQMEEAELYKEAWKKERAKIFATDPSASPTVYDFNISRGIPIEGDVPNSVAGTLISDDVKTERQILKNQSIIQIPTNKAVIFKGRAINFPNGRPVLVYGDNVTFLNNIKLDGKRAELIYSVIEKIANDINERAKAGKKIVFSKTKEAKFLQNILYWKDGSTKEGSNQINISDDGTTISFGGKSFPIAEIAENKSGLINEISKAFHNVNNKSLSQDAFDKPFTEFYLEKGELKTREWNNYQSYLLSSTFPDGKKRPITDTPLTTKIAKPIPDAVPYTHQQKYSTLIGLELPVGVISKPAAKGATSTPSVKNKFTYDGTTENTASVMKFGDVTFTVKEGENPQFLEDEKFKQTQTNIVKKLKQNSPESSDETLEKQANGVILSVVNKEIDTDLKNAQVVVAEPTPAPSVVPTAEAPVVVEEVKPMAPPEVVAEQTKKREKANIERITDAFEPKDNFKSPVDAWGIVIENSKGELIKPEITVVIKENEYTKKELLEIEDPENPAVQETLNEIDRLQKLLDAELKALETTPTPAPVVDKKADIERRRQEAIEGIQTMEELGLEAPVGKEGFFYADAFGVDPEESDLDSFEGKTKQEVIDKINAKYDAELARELYKEMKAGKLVTDMTPAEQQVTDKYITEELRKSVDAELAALEGAKPAEKKYDPSKTKKRGNLFRAVGELDDKARMTDEDIEILKKWQAEKVPQIPYEVLEQMVSINPDRKAWGVFENGVAKFVRGGLRGTEYHEIFHGIWRGLLTSEERARIVKEFNSREGSFKDRLSGKMINFSNATEDQVEDRLADDFGDYRTGKLPARTLGEAIRNFFKRIMDFFKSFVTKPTLKDQLFKEIEQGKFKDRELSPEAKAMAPAYRAVEGLTEEQTNAHVQDMTALSAAIIFGNGQLGAIDKSSIYDFAKITSKQVFDKIKELYEEQGWMDQISETAWNQLVEKTKLSLRANLKIVFSEEDLVNINDEQYSNRNYAPEPFQTDYKKTAPIGIRFVSSTIPKTKAMSQEGKSSLELPDLKDKNNLYSLVPYGQVFSTVINKLSNTSVGKIAGKLFNLAQKDSDYVRFFQRMGGDISTGTIPFENFKYSDWRVFIELVKTYTKQKPNAVIEYVQGDQVYSGSALVTSIVNATAKGWIQNIRNLAKESDSIIKFDSVDKAYKVTDDISNISVDKPQQQLEFANRLGIEFSKDVYDRLTKDQKEVDFPKAINAIKNTLQADRQILNVQTKTLDIAGPLNSLAEMYVSVTNPMQTSTRTNIEGNQTNSFTDSNTPSVFETIFNEVKTLDELLEIRPELNDVFSRGSQVLKKGGLFFDKEGVRTNLLLKLGYIEGRNDNNTNSGKAISNLTDGEKLALEINQNINGQYYVLIPADSSTEWMMNLGNNIQFPEFETEEAWDKVNDIFVGYLLDDINLAMDASNREHLRNIGDKASELRFFGEILSEKHASAIQEMIDDEKSIDDINVYIKENLKDKEGVPGIESDIKNFIIGTSEETIQKLKDNSVIVSVSENEFKYSSLDSTFAKNEKLNKNKLTKEDIDNIVMFANTNYIISNFEFHKILFGDPFQFAIKDGNLDETKRIKSFLSPRQITVDTKELNSHLNTERNKAGGIELDPKDPGYHEFKSYTKTITLSDVNVVSSLANNKNLPKEVRNAFMKVNEGDASSVLEIGTYREIMIKNSQWPDVAEDWYQWQMAYTRQNMPGYEYTNTVLEEHDEALLKTPEPKYVLNVLKPIVTGTKNGQKFELVLDKFSQMPLYYKAIQGTSLESLYLKMINPENKIGYAVMISGRKVGATELYDFYKDGLVNNEPFKGIVEVPWKIYGIQVENNYEGAGSQTRGSQLTKLSTLDLYENGEPIGETPERKAAIQSAVERNTKLLNEYHRAKYNSFLKNTGLEDLDGVYRIVNSAALAKALQDEMLRRALSDNIVDSIQRDENGEFIIPFEASSAYIQIRDILYSFIDESIGSPKMTGGPHVQVPVTGWENASKGRSLAVKTEDGYRKITRDEYEKMKDKSGVILTEDTLKIYEDEKGKRYCEVMIPYWFKNLGNLSGKTDAEILKYLNTSEGRKILTGVGFRIPTQALSSTEVFVVKGFLPKAMGKTVVVPSAITTKAGSDFDIDKLNMYLKATYIDRNGNLKLVTLQGDETQTKQFYAKVFDDSLAGKQMRKSELLEAVQILSYGLDDPKNLVEKYRNVFDTRLANMEDTSDYEQSIIDEIQELGDRTIQDIERDNFAEEMYIRALENEYYDSLEELLTLPENFKRLVNPVGDDGLKEISKKLDKLRGYNEDSIKGRLLNRNFMSGLRSAFITGKAWVGIVAVNITGQSLTQKSKIIIDPERFDKVKNKKDQKILKYNNGEIALDHNKMEMDGKEYVSISGIYDADKKSYISDGLSGYATAVVDVSKDPYILKIIQSNLLVGTFMFLRRIGVPNEQLIMFMNQPIIDEYVRLLNRNKSKTLFDDRYMDEIKLQFVHDLADETNNFDKNELEKNISTFYKEGGFDSKKNAEQIAIFKEFLKYAKMAEFSFNLTQASNYDTTKFRSAESFSNKEYRQEFAEEYNIFSSVDELLRNTHIGEQAMYLDKSIDALSEYLVLDRPEFMEITDKLMEPYYRDQYISKDKRAKIGNKMKASLLDFIIQRRSDVAANLYSDLVDTGTSVASMLAKAKKDFPSVKIINDLEVDSSGRIGGAQTIKLRVNDKSKDSVDMYTGMMRELRDDPRTNALYNGIVKLAILQGTYQSNISIKNIIPIEDYSSKITKIVTGLKADDEIKLFASSYEFQRNEFADDSIVPIVTPRFREVEETSVYSEDAPRRFQAAFIPIRTAFGKISVPGQFPTIQGLGVKSIQRQLLFLNEKYDAKAVNYDVVKVPRAVPIDKKKLDEGKIDVATGMEITNQLYAEKAKIGDTSLQNFYGFQKVKNMDGSPVIAKYDNEGNAIYVYKFINLHGDGKYASEYYGDGRPSVFNNGSQKNIVTINGTKVSGEIPDGTIANYFMENAISDRFSPISESITQSSQPQIREELKPAQPLTESRSLVMQPDNIAKIKAGTKTITNRTEKFPDGIYTLPDGTQVKLTYQGQADVQYIGDSVIVTANDTNRTWGADEFAKAEGFKDWSDFQKNNKFSKSFIDGKQSRYIYAMSSIAPTETLKEVKTPKKANVKTEFKSVNLSSGKEGINKGYKLTFEEYPNAEIYITKDFIEEDGQISTLRNWTVKETKTYRVFPIESSKLSDIVEEMRDLVNKQMKSETGRKLLESVGFTNKPKEESINFDNLTEFSSERKQEILTNFAAKHKMTQEQAINYINEALQKNRSEVIAKLKECY